MWVAFANAKATHIFFSKNISVYAIFYDQSSNDTLTNDIVSFQQLALGFFSCFSGFCLTLLSHHWEREGWLFCFAFHGFVMYAVLLYDKSSMNYPCSRHFIYLFFFYYFSDKIRLRISSKSSTCKSSAKQIINSHEVLSLNFSVK